MFENKREPSQFNLRQMHILLKKGILYNARAKNWRSHIRQWRVKTDGGHQELTVKRPMCDYATEFRKVAM